MAQKSTSRQLGQQNLKRKAKRVRNSHHEEISNEGEAMFWVLVEASREAVFMIEPDGTFIAMNTVAARRLGSSVEQLVGKCSFDLFSPELAQSRRQALKKFVESKKPLLHEDQHGQKKLASHLYPILDDDGNVIRIAIFATDTTPRKRAEQFLRESERKYRTLFNHSSDAIFIHDLDGNILDVNQKALDLFGYTKGEMLFIKLPMLYSSNVDEQSRKAFDAIANQGTVQFETEFVKRDGAIIVAEVTSTLFELGDRQMVQGVVRDVTGRKRAEERSRKLNQLSLDLLAPEQLADKLRRVTDSVVDIFGADFSRIWIVRPGNACQKGCPYADRAEPFAACVHPKECLQLAASSGRYTHLDGAHSHIPMGCHKIGQVATGEKTQFLTNDVANEPSIHDAQWARDINLVAFAGYRLLSGDGAVIGVLALFSQRVIKREEDALLESLAGTTAQVIQTATAQQALKRSEANFKLLAESTADVIYKVDVRTEKYSYTSPSVQAVFGYAPEEADNKMVADTLTPESFERQRDTMIRELIERNKKAVIMEVEGVHKNGQILPLEIHASLIRDDQGRPFEIVGVARDISQRKQTE